MLFSPPNVKYKFQYPLHLKQSWRTFKRIDFDSFHFPLYPRKNSFSHFRLFSTNDIQRNIIVSKEHFLLLEKSSNFAQIIEDFQFQKNDKFHCIEVHNIVSRAYINQNQIENLLNFYKKTRRKWKTIDIEALELLIPVLIKNEEHVDNNIQTIIDSKIKNINNSQLLQSIIELFSLLNNSDIVLRCFTILKENFSIDINFLNKTLDHFAKLGNFQVMEELLYLFQRTSDVHYQQLISYLKNQHEELQKKEKEEIIIINTLNEYKDQKITIISKEREINIDDLKELIERGGKLTLKNILKLMIQSLQTVNRDLNDFVWHYLCQNYSRKQLFPFYHLRLLLLTKTTKINQFFDQFALVPANLIKNPKYFIDYAKNLQLTNAELVDKAWEILEEHSKSKIITIDCVNLILASCKIISDPVRAHETFKSIEMLKLSETRPSYTLLLSVLLDSRLYQSVDSFYNQMLEKNGKGDKYVDEVIVQSFIEREDSERILNFLVYARKIPLQISFLTLCRIRDYHTTRPQLPLNNVLDFYLAAWDGTK